MPAATLPARPVPAPKPAAVARSHRGRCRRQAHNGASHRPSTAPHGSPATENAASAAPPLGLGARAPSAAGKAQPSGGVAGRAGHRLPPSGGRGNRAAAPGCSLTMARSWDCTGTQPPAAPAPGPSVPPSAILRARDAAGDAATARKETPPSPSAALRRAHSPPPVQCSAAQRDPPCAHAPWGRVGPG